MITIRVPDLTESQLAEIALAIQNRWGVPTFVKMHELVIVDEDEEEQYGRSVSNIERDFEPGFKIILQRLEMSQSFRFERAGKRKFNLLQVPGERMPTWLEDSAKPKPLPEGVYECPHCGKLFNTELEYTLHRNLHYII